MLNGLTSIWRDQYGLLWGYGPERGLVRLG